MQDSYSGYSTEKAVQDGSLKMVCVDMASTVHEDRGIGNKVRALVLFLCFFAGLLFIHSSFFSYRPFVSIGPIAVSPDVDIVFPFQCLVILLAGIVGIYNLLKRGDLTDFVDPLIAAAISSCAAVGLYLLCYTLSNVVFRTLFVLLIAAIVVLATVGWRTSRRNGTVWSLYDGLIGPVRMVLCCAGLVTILLPWWALTAESYSLQMPEEPEQRTLTANIDTAEKFFAEEWRLESLKEKATDLGVIAVVKSEDYGVNLPFEITVSALPGYEVASYEPRGNKITLNTSYLATGAGIFWIESVTHEVVHAFQWQACAGQISADDAPELFPDEDILERWRYEINYYVTYTSDVDGYFSQEIEEMAESLGWAALWEIEARVDKYHETGDPEP